MFERQRKMNVFQEGVWVSLLEKTTELRLFLHLFCASIYAECFIQCTHSRQLWGMSNADLMAIPFALIAIGLVGYFGLMGLLFPLMHAMLRFLAIHLGVAQRKERSSVRGEMLGMVHRSEILKESYKTKNYELMRLLEAHRQTCMQSRLELRSLAGLALAGIVLLFGTGFLADGGYFWAFLTWVEIGVGSLGSLIALLVLVGPLLVIIYVDLQDDQGRDEYLYFPPLYYQLQKPMLEAFPKIEGCR